MRRRRYRYPPLIASALGARLGVDGVASHLAMQQFDPASRPAEERVIAVAYGAATLVTLLTGPVGEQLWLSVAGTGGCAAR